MEYTIEITAYCPCWCSYCSTRASTDGKHLGYAYIKEFLESFDIKTEDRINISGGEPLAHPDFYLILKLCEEYTKDVWVYTNALSKIRYNSSVVGDIRVEAKVCLVPGDKVYIPKNADKVHLLQLGPQGRAENMEPADIHVSGNCVNDCESCGHRALLQADGRIVSAPCKKEY